MKITDNDIIELSEKIANIEDKKELEYIIYFLIDNGLHGMRSIIHQYCEDNINETYNS